MKLLIYTLFVVLIFTVFSFSQTKYTWVGGSGSWQTASNWTPNGIPGAADTAVVNSGTVTNDSTVFVASLFQNGGTINGTGEINIADSLSFANGIQTGTGSTKLSSGCNGAIISSQSKQFSRGFINDGYLIWQGANVTFSGCVFTNNGTFDANSESSIFGFGGGGSIINNGSIIRSTATGTATISVPISNQGNINVKSGILQSSQGVTGNGSFIIEPGAVYVLSGGTHTLGGNTISGGGTFELKTGQILNVITGNVTVLAGTTFLQSSGTITGDGDLIIGGYFDFRNGIQSGNGATKISIGGTCLAGGTQSKQFSRNLLNDGIFTWNGGNITFGGSKTFINNGTFNAETESGLLNSLGGVSILNNGVFNRSTGSANVTIAPKFVNNNELKILSGSITFNGSLINNNTGKIKGVGTLSLSNNNKLFNKGTVEPGIDVGVLQFNGYYSQTSEASLKIEIGGFAAGTERDSISVVGAASLNGELSIQFINNFVPQDGDVFPLMSYTSRNGEFTQVNFSNNVIGYVQYNSNGAQIVIGDPSSVGEESDLNNVPDTYELAQNYPNPFNPTTKISWQSPVGGHQTIKAYDVLGNEVATLVDEFRNAGAYEVTFDASNLSSGIYFYRLQAGSFVEIKKMILLR
jgi:hypothetical protein